MLSIAAVIVLVIAWLSYKDLNIVAMGGALLLFLLLIATSVMIHTSILSREQAFRTSRDAREYLETTLASIGDAVIATDAAGRIVFSNSTAQALLRWPTEEMAGKHLDEVFRIVNEYTRDTVESPVAKVLREGTVVGLANHTILIARDGTEVPIDDSGAPIRDPDGTVRGTVMVFRDITERRHADAVSRLLASIVESSDDAIISKDLHGIITSWNRAAEHLYGYTAAEAIGQPITRISVPGHVDEMAGILERIAQGQRIDNYETMRRTKDGQLVHVSLTISPILDAIGCIVGASKIARNITERIQAQEALARNTERLARANANLEQFASAVSHDLQEPLRTVVTFAELLTSRYHGQLDAEADQFIGYISTSATRMLALINDLLDYSRVVNIDNIPVTEVELNEAAAAAVHNLQLAIQESQAVIDIAPLPTVRAEQQRMVQLFQNLLSNALKYRSDARPVIQVSAEQHAAEWIISVRDNGVGIPSEYHDYIFGVFKRLHGQTYPGTGVGLALCKQIVERLGGRIWVESPPGQGSTFKFSLPTQG
jgi:PAS domain S-box-containing protein